MSATQDYSHPIRLQRLLKQFDGDIEAMFRDSRSGPACLPLEAEVSERDFRRVMHLSALELPASGTGPIYVDFAEEGAETPYLERRFEGAYAQVLRHNNGARICVLFCVEPDVMPVPNYYFPFADFAENLRQHTRLVPVTASLQGAEIQITAVPSPIWENSVREALPLVAEALLGYPATLVPRAEVEIIPSGGSVACYHAKADLADDVHVRYRMLGLAMAASNDDSELGDLPALHKEAHARVLDAVILDVLEDR